MYIHIRISPAFISERQSKRKPKISLAIALGCLFRSSPNSNYSSFTMFKNESSIQVSCPILTQVLTTYLTTLSEGCIRPPATPRNSMPKSRSTASYLPPLPAPQNTSPNQGHKYEHIMSVLPNLTLMREKSPISPQIRQKAP